MSGFNRTSPRLLDYDYAQPGAYFVTACTKNRKCVLGRVTGETVTLSVEGEIVKSVWQALPNHYPHLKLDEFIIMPNHIHGILWLLETRQPHVGAGLRPAPTQQAKCHGLPEIMRALKSFSSRRVNEINHTKGQSLWQRSFYEHILRDDEDLYNHRKYIQENPLKWTLDDYYREAQYA